MDETRAEYGTTSEVVVTFVGQSGATKTIKLPDALETNDITTYATAFRTLAINSDTAVIGIPEGNELTTPVDVKIDVVTTTRRSVI